MPAPSIYNWYPTRFISAFDLRDRHATVQIERWTMEVVRRNGEETTVPVIYFFGKKKGMRVNKTNARIIGRLHGHNPDGWIGKWITIYPAAGRLDDEVKVEPKVPEVLPKKAEPAPATLGPEALEEEPAVTGDRDASAAAPDGAPSV